MACKHASPGFTLIEVMVALVVVALGMLAAFGTINQSTMNASRLQKRTMANWIAMNQLTEIRLQNRFPDTGTSDGSVEFASQDWQWSAAVSETQVEGLRRVDVSVALADAPDDNVITVAGFIGRPPPDGLAVTPWTGRPGGIDNPGDPDNPGNPEPPGDGRDDR